MVFSAKGIIFTMKETLGERLRRLRKIRGLPQVVVAEEVGIARAYLASLETDRREGSLAILAALADYFEVTLDYIYRGDQHHPSENLSMLNKLWEFLSEEERSALVLLLKSKGSDRAL